MSSYKNVLDKITWSFSRLHMYEICKYSLYKNKIEKIDDDETNFYAQAGSFMHKILQMLLIKELDINDAIDYFIDNYDNNIDYEVKQSIMEKRYNQAIDYLAELDTIIFDKYYILGVEKKVKFELDGKPFIGFIDLLLKDKKTNKIILVDHKSSGHFLGKNGKPLKNQLESFEAYKKQMYLYSYAIKEEYGEFPERIVWNHFFENTITNIPFDENEYNKSIKWAKNILNDIYADEEFEANPSYFYCNTLCGYRGSCEYLREEG